VDVSILQDKEKEDSCIPIPAIMESKSFEESCKEYIANSPCEMVDTSNFGPSLPCHSRNNDERDNDEKTLSLPSKIHDNWREHAWKIWDNTPSFSTISVLHNASGVQRVKEKENIPDGATKPVVLARYDGVFAPIPMSYSRNAECEKDNGIDTFLSFLDNVANIEDEEVKWFHMKKNTDGSVDF